MAHELAGTKVRTEDLVDLTALCNAYYEVVPSVAVAGQKVSFGTSGHRGISTEGSFNDLHVATITQAVCDGRQTFGAQGPCFVGHDTHALSTPALRTVLEVLAGNGVVACVDSENGFVPTPSVSRAIIRYNEAHEVKADGLIITPSHNPPDNGGIKYNPTNGGPADTSITGWIEAKANEYLAANGKGIQRTPLDVISEDLQIKYDYKGLYVAELAEIIDIEAIQKAKPKVLINALGGSGAAYWQAISEAYDLNLTIINGDYDPSFSFMTYDHDGAIRMDCSSAYAMADVVAGIGAYDLAVGNDPDYDRYGIVTKDGLMAPNHFLVTAGSYLFKTRSWTGKGFGKTIVVTGLVDRYCRDAGIPVYEVPVGFKYFSPLLFDGTIGIGGEESAGASFLKKDGTVWTTDKDGMIMGLLAMEMWATTGKSPADLYETLTAKYGTPYFTRVDTPCTLAVKTALKKLSAADVTDSELNGEPITAVRTNSAYGEYAIGGLQITVPSGFVVARPSGTENLYKVYAESFSGEAALQELVSAGSRLVESVAL